MARMEPRERSLVLVRPRGKRLPAEWPTQGAVAAWMAIQYDPEMAEEAGEGIRGRTLVTSAYLWSKDDTVPEECVEDVIGEWEDTFARDIAASSWEYLVLQGVMMGSMRGRGFRKADRPQQPSSTNDSRGSAGVGSDGVGRRRGRGNAGAPRARARASGRTAAAGARSGRSRRR